MLSEVLRDLVDRQPDMEVAGELLDPIELLFAVRTTPVDAVILTPLDAKDRPRICRHLLAEHPGLKIVTLSAQGETAFLYESGSRRKRIDEPSGRSILDAVRASVRPRSG